MFTDEEKWLNFILGNELDVSGALIFGGLEHIASLKVLSNADEVYTLLYYLSQGFERLIKVASIFTDDNPRKLVSKIKVHSTNDIFDEYLEHHIPLREAQKGLLDLLTEFYKYRYNHLDYGDPKPTTCTEYPTGEYSMYPKMLRLYIQGYSKIQTERKKDDLTENMQCSFEVKKFLHSIVKETAIKVYDYICQNSFMRNLYIYELRSDSKAFYVFIDESDSLLKKRAAIYELILYVIKNVELLDKNVIDLVDPLELDFQSVKEIVDIINSKTSIYDVFDDIKSQINDMDLDLREERLSLHSYILGD